MRFNKKKIATMLVMALVITLSFAGNAFATSFFDVTMTKLRDVFVDVKNTVFIIGGFGLVAVAFAAIFGKVNWKWFAGLAAGLAILAAAGMAINYVVGTGTSVDTQTMGDTFNQ